MLRSANFVLLSLILACIFPVTNSTLRADDSPEVGLIAQTAVRAQEAGDFAFAASQWEKLIAEYPQSEQVGVAYFQAGYCHVQTKAWQAAIQRLEQAIKSLDREQKVSIAQSYLFLGFAESKLGRQIATEDAEASQQLLTTSTQTFLTLLQKFPEFDDADQALYFQAEAFEALGRLDEAADSYTKMLALPEPEFKLDGLFALAFIRAQQGKYDVASDLYAKFEAAGTQHPSFNEVRFRSAEVLLELAEAAENLGETERTSKLLNEAMQKFAVVYESRDPDWADRARFQQAHCTQKLGQFGQSAQLFESIVAEIPNSKLVDQARVYAGRDFLRAGQTQAAQQLLAKAVAVPSPHAAEAAHWLAQLQLRSNQHDQAYLLAEQWIGQTDNAELKVPLMLDQADAAYASSARRPESRELYLKITDNFPNHRLAATALYNAAYAAMETGKFDDAIALSARFRKEFANSDYLPDLLEVEGDSFLLNNNPEASEKSFVELLDTFGNHPKSPAWRLRAGLARFMQKKYAETIAWLEPVIEQLQQPDRKAEALHWVGSSQYQLGQARPAIKALRDSFATDPTWRRADETLLTLSRSLYLDQQADAAKGMTRQMITQFPESPLLAEANYRLAEFEYDDGNFDAALQHYEAVAENFGESQFAPYAIYGIGWTHLQQKKFENAADSFTKLIETHSDHPLATQALIGRASGYRQSGSPEKAIADIDAWLASDNPAPGKKAEALYERGLAQIAQESWPDAIATFTELLTIAPESKLADRFNYELAWAYRSNGDANAGLKHFQAIAERWPDSPLAAEAGFHVAQSLYKREDYEGASKAFETVIAKSPAGSELREKAIYKLAWSFYKKKDFDNALAAFRRQIAEFPAGSPLHADGQFMVSESLYENDKFKEALQEYRVAKPIIESSTTVSPNYRILTLLHGAQSANLSAEHDAAIEFAQSLLELDNVDNHIKQDAQMELGDAYRSLQQLDKAVKAYEQAAQHPGKTGARSMCMIGEILLDQKRFPDAINKFKLVLYGYGGTESKDDVKPWQAVAAYEAARCSFVQISSSSGDPQLKQRLIDEAKKHFEYLVKHYPDHKLAAEATQRIEQLNAME